MMDKSAKTRNVVFILVGVSVLVLKKHYSGPFVEIIHSYGSNVSVSLAVYFVVRMLTSGWRNERFVTAGIALLVVELFEATDGFGVMSNVYDPFDFMANVLGVGLALMLDALISLKWSNERDQDSP